MLACGINMEYQACGIACQPTCENQNEPLLCQQNCTSGCFCKPGYVLDIDKCVLPRNCPCYVDNVRYEVCERFCYLIIFFNFSLEILLFLFT